MGRSIATLAAALVLLGAPFAARPAAGAGLTQRASVSTAGTQGNNGSLYTAISADGRYIAFESTATNLVAGDTNGWQDVFVRDTVAGTTKCVSVSSSGEIGNSWSGAPSISADGRYVAFESYATNFAPGCDGTYCEVFVHDCASGTTTCVSIPPGASTEIDGDSTSPSISADGRYVAFASTATTLIPDDSNWSSDIFVCDGTTGDIMRVSVASDGSEADGGSYYPSISSDGRFVAFQSDADNLVGGDTNSNSDVFVRDCSAGTTERVSVSSSGAQGYSWSGYPSISANGSRVAFASISPNLAAGLDPTDYACHVYVRDLAAGATWRASVKSDGTPGDSDSSYPSISGDGRYVAFESIADNLVSGDINACRDVFVHDNVSGITEIDSVSSSGAQGGADSYEPVLSGDGRVVAFASDATTLVSGDTNGCTDVFCRARTKIASGISLYADEGLLGGATMLRAILVGGGSGIPGRTLSFAVDGTTVGKAVTDDAGNASLPYTIPSSFATGYHNVTASFDGTNDPQFSSSTRSGAALLCRVPTGISIYTATGTIGQTAQLRAIMASGGAPVAGCPLGFSVDGTAAGTGTTDATGVASCTFTIPAGFSAGMHNVTATFAATGDLKYAPSSRTASALVCRAPTAIAVGAARGIAGQAVTLSGVLTSSGTPVSGRTLTFAVGGTAVGSAVTGSGGTATCAYTIPAATAPGTYAVTASFAANGDTAYGPSTQTAAALTVTVKAGASISIRQSAGLAGQATTLSCLLYSGGKPLPGKIVSFTVAGSSTLVSGTTDTTGTASASYMIPAGMAAGLHDVTASFDGSKDASYASTTRTTPALTVSTKQPTAISISPVSGYPGEKITLRCLLYSGGKPLPSKKVSFSVADFPGLVSGTTDTTGTAAASYTIPATASALVDNVTAAFDGSHDPLYSSTTRTAPALTVYAKHGTSISIRSASGYAGQTITLRCLLYSGGKPLPGKKVSFSVTGLPGVVSGTTDATGTAAASYAIPSTAALGVYKVTAAFDGSQDPMYWGTTRTAPALTVYAKHGTSISIGSVTGSPGQTITLRCLLYSGGKPLPGKKVSFSVIGLPGVVSGTTDATGTAAASYTIPSTAALGVYNVTAAFDGSQDPLYSSTTRTAPALTVYAKHGTSISIGSVTGSPGQTITLRCLLYCGGKPLPGKKVSFSVIGLPGVVSGTTDATGTAAASYTIPSTAALGVYNVTAAFDGSQDPLYSSTTRTAPALTVN